MSEQAKRTPSDLTPKRFARMVITRFAGLYIVLGLMFFLPAWTFNYWQAWVYMAILTVPRLFVVRYLYKYDPALLERRMRMREKQRTQKLVVWFSSFTVLVLFVIPGFDIRVGWSNVPLIAVVIADILVLFGYLIVALVFKTNTYASRIVEVEKGQKVVTTGPYAIVRHPMYLGMMILFTFSPLALGSYWAMLAAVPLIPLLVARIGGEEKELLANLEGYKEYAMETKYRLLPGVW